MIELAVGAGQIAREEQRDAFVAKTWNRDDRAKLIPLTCDQPRLLP